MLLTADDIRERLAMEARHRGSQAAVASAYGFTPAYISRVLDGEQPSRRLAEAMGYRRVVRFEILSDS